MKNKRIYVVFKTHFDIGFTELSEEVIRQYSRKMLPDVIETCEGTRQMGAGRQYVWSMPSWPLKKSLENDNIEESCREKACELIQEGKITWLALPFTTHTEYCGMEDLVRGLETSTDFSKQYGYWPLSAKMTDVPGHSWALPTILAGAGVRFLHLGCNPGCMSPDVPRLFWWEGPDGSRVLTFYSKGCYGTDAIPPADWPYDAWLALMQTNDNIGPQDSSIVKAIEDAVYKEMPDAQVCIGTLDDFYKDIIHCELDIPVISMDLADTWIHGVGTYPRETVKNRKTRKAVKEAESLLTALCAWGEEAQDDFSPTVSKIYENLLLFGEHTWGLDVKTHMGGYRHYDKESFIASKNSDIYIKMEKSWDEQRARANYAAEASQNLLETAQNKIGSQIRTEDESIVVFCHTGLTTDRWVDVPTSVQGLVDTRTGEPVKIRCVQGKKQAFVKNPPALGYVTLRCTVKNASSQGEIFHCENEKEGCIENACYRIRADKATGKIVSVYDKILKKEWVDPACEDGFAGYRYDRYGIEDITRFERDYTYRFYDWLVNDLGRIGYPQCGHETYRPMFEQMHIEASEDEVTLVLIHKGAEKSVMQYGDAERIVTSISLNAHDEQIKVRFDIHGKQETSYIEAFHLTFPFKMARPRVRMNKIGGLVDPAKDIIKDANHVLYCLEDYISLTDGENGMMVVSHDVPLVSLGDERIYQYRSTYQEEKPWLYFNPWNNQWGTNFPQWEGGGYSFSFTLFHYKGEPVETACHEGAVEANALHGCSAASAEGKLPENATWIQMSEDVMISAFKPARYHEDAYILRLREHEGKSKNWKCRIQNLSQVIACDFQERPREELPVENECFQSNIPANGLKNYLLKFRK